MNLDHESLAPGAMIKVVSPFMFLDQPSLVGSGTNVKVGSMWLVLAAFLNEWGDHYMVTNGNYLLYLKIDDLYDIHSIRPLEGSKHSWWEPV